MTCKCGVKLTEYRYYWTAEGQVRIGEKMRGGEMIYGADKADVLRYLHSMGEPFHDVCPGGQRTISGAGLHEPSNEEAST